MMPELLPQAAEQTTLLEALVRLPFAAVFGALLALRPRRAGTPARKPAVVQTQVILAVMGALVMIVVGASLARAFGVVGLAGLGLGLACGVGLLWLAAGATVFLLGLLWVLESKEPERCAPFALTVKNADPAGLRRKVESVLRRHNLEYDLRSWGQDELVYSVEVPIAKRIDAISGQLVSLGGKEPVAVEWDEKKPK